MLGLFTLGNATVAWNFSTDQSIGPAWQWLVLFLVTFLFFFRLRCFDEIKDYEVDVEHNPTRPLARGLVSVSATKWMIACLVGLELGLVAMFLPNALMVYAIALVYSFLMYNEFFIGWLIRPQLTLYALSHTFVSSIVGLFIVCGAGGFVLSELPAVLFKFVLVNWALFNLFEFARKTYGPMEERDKVDTYSSLFGSAGAAALSLVQAAAACCLLVFLPPTVLSYSWAQFVLVLIPFGAGVLYVLMPDKYAKLFRSLVSAYLILFYLLLSIQALASL